MNALPETMLKFPELPDLAGELAARVRAIPPGRVTTFGDLARSLGDRHAAVWASQWVARNSDNELSGCHRVVRATGELSGSPAAIERQTRLLKAEGVRVTADAANLRRVSLESRFTEWHSSCPLVPLQNWLTSSAAAVNEEPLRRTPQIVAGFDVAYGKRGVACGAVVVVHMATASVIWSGQTVLPTFFPYVPGFLTFRELPVFLDLLRLAREAGFNPDVAFIDGQGKLHPRRAGIAVGFAAVTGLSTIGVGKSLLCGRVGEFESATQQAPVMHEGEIIAAALRPGTVRKPVFISVGGGITLEEAVELSRRLLQGRRLPQPIHEADRFSKRVARESPSRGESDGFL